jgi:hypothetical protein
MLFKGFGFFLQWLAIGKTPEKKRKSQNIS